MKIIKFYYKYHWTRQLNFCLKKEHISNGVNILLKMKSTPHREKEITPDMIGEIAFKVYKE